ncbi:MAG TPA: class II aldolase/adducin family protein [Vicinamibacterales bacterium]|nr:class II aldolase/adducin family protein [Vicinamibacterales bacterium]
MTAESQLRADIVEIGRRMYARGYTASNDGNISVRLGADRLLMTPKSVCKGFMTPDMMCITDLQGSKLQGDRDPSSEMLMHLEVYRQRADVQAVVHAHPPIATGFAVAGIPLDRAVLAEVLTTLGSIPIAAYATPSTSELPEAVRKYIKAHDGMLLANHGALTVGADLFAAYYKMETIEHFAKISLVARLLGRENLIAREEVDRLQGLRGTYGIKAHDGMLLANHGALTSGADLFAAYYKMETIEHFARISLVARLLGRENLIAREEVDRLQGLRGSYGIKAPAPICADPSEALALLDAGNPAICQVVQAPAGDGRRLVPEAIGDGATPRPGPAGEIRLTYRELSALIADAVRSLR